MLSSLVNLVLAHLPTVLLVEADGDVPAWSRAVRALAADVLVLDSPPHLGAGMGAIVGLADLALLPCGPSGWDLLATAELVGLVREIRQARGDGQPVILVTPNRVDRRTGAGRELAGALSDMGEAVTPGIGARAAICDAFNGGQWVGTYAPDSVAHHEIQALADDVLAHLGTRVRVRLQRLLVKSRQTCALFSGASFVDRAV